MFKKNYFKATFIFCISYVLSNAFVLSSLKNAQMLDVQTIRNSFSTFTTDEDKKNFCTKTLVDICQCDIKPQNFDKIYNQYEVVEFLLNNNADPNYQGFNGLNALENKINSFSKTVKTLNNICLNPQDSIVCFSSLKNTIPEDVIRVNSKIIDMFMSHGAKSNFDYLNSFNNNTFEENNFINNSNFESFYKTVNVIKEEMYYQRFDSKAEALSEQRK